MTPMQKLKNNLDTFTGLIGEQFTEVVLNKAPEKSTTIGGTWGDIQTTYEKKGVKNDFVKLYKIKFNKEQAYSFAFNFNYLNLPEEDHNVEFTLKVGTDNPFIIDSGSMSIKDFQQKLNQTNTIIRTFKEHNNNATLSYNEVIDIVGEIFINDYSNKLNYTSKINLGKKRIRKMV